jgi:methylmalonyl-CoA mutase N-terminal domain/subunit
LQRIDPALERKQVERLKAVRAKRDAAKWQQSIEGIQDGARHGTNLMPRIIAAVEANATVGEIADAMRVIFGEYRETVVL